MIQDYVNGSNKITWALKSKRERQKGESERHYKDKRRGRRDSNRWEGLHPPLLAF